MKEHVLEGSDVTWRQYMQKERLLITGSTGFVGSHLLRLIDLSSWTLALPVRTLSDLDVRYRDYAFPITDLVDVVSWCKRNEVSHVVHLAAASHARGKTKTEVARINTVLTELLAESVSGPMLRSFIFMSSAKVVGQAGLGISEDCTCSPDSVYGVSKLMAEQALHSISRRGELPLTIFRPSIIYGAGVKGNLASMLALAKSGCVRFPEVTGVRSMVSAHDVARAIVIALERGHNGRGTYFLADGVDYRFGDIFDAMQKAYHAKISGVRLPKSALFCAAKAGDLFAKFGLGFPFSGDSFHSVFSDFTLSCEFAKARLGWKPVDSFYSNLPKLMLR